MSRKTLALLGTTVLLGLVMIGCSSHSSFVQPTSRGVTSGNDPIIDISHPSQETQSIYLARLHTELATGYYSRKQYQIALEEVAEALKADSQYAPAYGMMALTHAILGDNTGAENAFIRAIQVSPNDPDIRNNFGAFLCERRRFRESLEHFDHALRNSLYQTPQIALRNAAECASKGGDTERAARYYKQLGQPMPETSANPAPAAPPPARPIVQQQQPSATTYTYAPQPATPAASSSDSAFKIASAAYEQGDLLAAQDSIKRALQAPQSTAATIHLAMCIERRFANATEEERYADLLLNQFPQSAEARSLNTTNRGCS